MRKRGQIVLTREMLAAIRQRAKAEQAVPTGPIDPRVLDGVHEQAVARLEASVSHLVSVLSTKGEVEVEAALEAIPHLPTRRRVRRRLAAVKVAQRNGVSHHTALVAGAK